MSAQVDGPLLDKGDAERDGGRVGVWLGPLDFEPPTIDSQQRSLLERPRGGSVRHPQPPKVNLVAELEEALLPTV